MKTADLFGFAWRALSRHRLRTSLSLLGVAVGVTAVVVLTALGEGARRYVVDQFASIGSSLLIVVPGRVETTGGIPGIGGAPNDLTLADAEALVRRVSGVRRVAPMAAGTESIAHGERRREVAVLGVTEDFLEVRHLALGRGSFLPPTELGRGSNGVVIGYTVAEELFPGADPLGQVVRVGGWRFRVLGVLAPMGTQLGIDIDEVVLIPVATALSLFDRSSLFRILVDVEPGADHSRVSAALRGVLTERHGEEDVTVISQDSVVSAVTGILQALNLAVAAIAAISLAVAGIGILNVMLVAVSERTSEVGLLKALGAGRRQILAVFLVEAAALSTAGGLVGLAGGYALAGAIARAIPALPASPPPWAVAAALAVAMGVGITFGLLPARRASRLDPIDALRSRG